MDGVPYVSFPPIQPGETFIYEFPIRQSGTYWYHSHSGLQEQIGMYGSIVIEPAVKVRDADHDYVIVFVEENRLLIAVAETYDVLVRMPDSGSYEFGLCFRLDRLRHERSLPMIATSTGFLHSLSGRTF